MDAGASPSGAARSGRREMVGTTDNDPGQREVQTPKTLLAQFVVRADDKLGQQKVNKAAPEHPRTSELIRLNRPPRAA